LYKLRLDLPDGQSNTGKCDCGNPLPGGEESGEGEGKNKTLLGGKWNTGHEPISTFFIPPSAFGFEITLHGPPLPA
jgi:hypothetical protein